MAKNSTYWDKKLPKNLEESSYTPWLNDKLCVLPPEGEIVLDKTGKKNGRGAYLCNSRDCLLKATKSKGLERSFKMSIPDEVYDDLEKEFTALKKEFEKFEAK